MREIEKILYLMEVNGVNAKKLTADLGMAVSSVTDWKKGKAKPSVEAIVKIAQYFKVTTDYLLYDEVDLPIHAPTKFTETEIALINRTREMKMAGSTTEGVGLRLSLSDEAIRMAERWDALDDDGHYVVGNAVVQEERRIAHEMDNPPMYAVARGGESAIDKIFLLLETQKKTAKNLAESIGVSTGNVSDWKSRRSRPNVDALPKLADYFNVSVDYLLGRTDKPEVNR